MSSEVPSRRSASRKRRGRSFVRAFGVVIAVLAVVGAAGAAANVAQGPRVTDVQFDAKAAVATSGSRVIVTTSQSLAEIDPSQVTINPATPFAIDTSGRSVGVRFTLPLWDDTEYTVTIEDLESLGGGPTTTVTETFTTPPIDVHLLRRDAAGDTIFRTDLSGENAVAVFTDDHIEDFRATSTHLVISTLTDAGEVRLVMTDLEGENPQELPVPGDGFVSNLQSADRGELVGYTFSDADLTADSGRESALFTASLKEPDAAPVPISVAGADERIAEWRFVPDTDSILLLSFDGTLLLGSSEGLGGAGEGEGEGEGSEESAGGEGTNLGTAVGIDGIARGSASAIVERVDQRVSIDLTDATEEPLVDPAEREGIATSVTPLPDGSTIRAAAVIEGTSPTGRTAVEHIDTEGEATPVAELPDTDALLQVCVSPSARYVALSVAPDVINNPYDTYRLPLPEYVETRIIDITTGTEVVAVTGSAISWCQVPVM